MWCFFTFRLVYARVMRMWKINRSLESKNSPSFQLPYVLPLISPYVLPQILPYVLPKILPYVLPKIIPEILPYVLH